MSKKSGLDLSGLDSFSSLMGGSSNSPAPVQNESAEPVLNQILEIPRSKIHPDPNNVRKVFDQEEIQNLAASMSATSAITGKPRGVKVPLSVRPHPELAGEFILNAGARRMAAAEIAGIELLPCFVDAEADEYDNAVDNIQRVGLSAMEMAAFIKSRIDAGDKKGDVAKRLGKPGSFVTEHMSFFDMADCIRDLYDSGLVTSMQALYLLHKAYETYPEEVESLCAKGEPLTKTEVRDFVESLKKPAREITIEDTPEMAISTANPSNIDSEESGSIQSSEEQHPITIDDQPISGGEVSAETQADKLIKDADNGDKIKKPIIQVKHDERPANFVPNKRADYGYGWIKYADDGHEVEVLLSEVSLVAVIEG
ncbi:TPA: ParB/RepB/Spo0J family partition protein [Klebsiella variicola subsp. variicola]|nr:ParB/RepB/Spo0J family partition protein [Klebsiella variicola subsp. variicola]HCI4627463.1 ParB/RepB/Spo0J family partition protein [Klebsiella variicola subsp. variicola]HCI6660946.1 ParB/RepB/Spo0J family partition protein [Klebsiella variicola subsp. variicola]